MRYTDNMFSGPYIPPILVVDSVIFRLTGSSLVVLLIQRSHEPFAGDWALPGAYCAAGETTGQAMDRILAAKAGLSAGSLGLVEQLFTFDTVARDPRGHAVSVTYMGLCKDTEPEISETTQNPLFYPVTDLPQLAYDHGNIIKYAHERLKAKLGYTNAVQALLPKHFTMSQLQTAYEAVLCRPLDKRNFRKKFLSLDLIEETDEMLQDGPHRPARLYKFHTEDLQTLTRSFD